MSVIVVTPPAALVAVADAKACAPVFADDPDARVMTLLQAAQAAMEPPNGWLGRAFGVQTLQASFDDFEAPRLRLPFPPLRSVASVTYRGMTGTDQILASDAFRVLGIGTAAGAIAPVRGGSWPAGAPGEESVRVEFEAGYVDDDPQVRPIQHAIVLAAVQLRALSTQDLALRSRSTEGVGSRTWTVSDAAYQLVQRAIGDLLQPLRVYA